MAIYNYLISGLPGTGKTTVCKELQSRGLHAIDADSAFGFQDKGRWLWNEDELLRIVDDATIESLFICGSASNRDAFINKFDKVFILYVDDKTLANRLASRTNNNFGKNPEIAARQIELNQGVKAYSVRRERIVINAARPISEVVDEIVALSKKI